MTTVAKMENLPIFSDRWFDAAFKNCTARESVKSASRRICCAYGIRGQADPAHIANLIETELNYKKHETKT